MRKIRLSTTVLVFLSTVLLMALPATPAAAVLTGRTLDGTGNNLRNPQWGSANTQYLRVAVPRYADGTSAMVGGPAARYVSNRVFNDVGQNLFSENGLTQWQLLNQPGFANTDNKPLTEKAVTLTKGDLVTFK